MQKELPKTYNIKEVEDKWKDVWMKEKTYQFNYDKNRPLFIVDTPPPYVSADHLHAGHIMSYSQAEFIIRFKRMKGYNVFYPMGFDDNGLPTERFVEKKHKIDKSKITKSDFVKICLKETEKGAQAYKKLWNDIGISVDWSKTYSTISPVAIKVSQWSLIDLWKKGALHRKKFPVLWCPFCQTALAQADLESKESNSKMNYINFKGPNEKKLTIVTTRPEMIPACVALYVNPKDNRFKDLINKNAFVPIFNYKVPIKGSDKVDIELGTGLMMVCTWGDEEDLDKWKVDGLNTRALVKEDGTLGELGEKYKGLKLLEARKQIINDLKTEGYLIKQEELTHAINTHERCGTPTEFIFSQQWFIKITEMEDVWLKRGKELNWYPNSRFKDYELWVKSIKWDWCISRQRYYGVPFPVWYCAKCEKPVFAEKKDLPVNPFEDKVPIEKCPKCNGIKFIPEQDVMDTWATSSCTPFLLRELVDKKISEKLFPVTLRPNAFEIIRTWDFYSIVKSHYNFNSIPFKDVMISGHGLDEKGKKISKQLGNYIPPDELLKEYGADAIRYWATGAILGQNLRFNIQEIKKGKKTTIKLWNVARFLAMNIEEFEINQEDIAFEFADIWIIEELNKVIKRTADAFERYSFANAKKEIDIFFWSKFTDYYIEFVKYRLFGEDKESKKAAQQTLLLVFHSVLKIFAPILPFITEEIYHEFFIKKGFSNRARSIHLSSWPEKIKIKKRLNISDFDLVISVINEIRKHKSEMGISLGAEIKEFKLKTKIDIDKYGEFIKKSVKVKKLIGKDNK